MSTQPLTFSPEHIKYSRYIPSHIPEEMYNGIQKLFSRNDREALKIPMGNQQPSAHYAVSIPLCVFEVEHKGEDWESLEKVRLPLCLNLSQCKLELGEYQEVVDLNSKLMNKHKGELIHPLTFHYLLYPVWLCMWQIIKNLEPWTLYTHLQQKLIRSVQFYS